MRAHWTLILAALLYLIAPAQAGIRANLSGDAVVDFATTMDMPLMTVGNPGNADDTHGDGYGGVDYDYNIGKFEVTAGQYTEFLNAVAATDTYGLYHINMDTAVDSWRNGCNIKQTGSSGNYAYSVDANWADRPVNYVGWGDAARFCNWLTNGMPTGAQDLTTTEDGSYFIDGAIGNADLMTITREPDAQYFIPTEDEWYKAAYHKNDGATGNYFDYPTSSDSVPSNNLVTPDGGNNANFYQGGYTIDSPYYRTEAGEFENSDSPYGTFDIGGNVFEWNETAIWGYRGLRGGSFYNYDYYLGAAERSYRYYPRTEGRDIGFRIASEIPGPPVGDFNRDGDVNALDIDALADAIRGNSTDLALFDISGDGMSNSPDNAIDIHDLDYLVRVLVETAMSTGSEYGDFNLDGLIDTTDLTRLATFFGPGTMWSEGNANRYLDLTIDTTDLTILATYYGFDASADAIPEPATMGLLALSGMAMLRRRK